MKESINAFNAYYKAGICLCTRGEKRLRINGREYTQRPGYVTFFTPLFTIQELSTSADYECMIVREDFIVLFGILRHIFNIVINFRIIEHPCFLIPQEAQQLMISRGTEINSRHEQLEMMTNETEKFLFTKSTQLLVQQTLVDIILSVYRKSPFKQEFSTIDGSLIVNFVFTLFRNFRQHRQVQYYAEQAGLSVNYFSSQIKRYLGCSPSEMITAITIANAKILLDQTQKSIKEISHELGFPDQFCFRKYFKQNVGIPPTEYRKRKQ